MSGVKSSRTHTFYINYSKFQNDNSTHDQKVNLVKGEVTDRGQTHLSCFGLRKGGIPDLD